MKLSITQKKLQKALNTIIKATASKPNIPVLSNVLINAQKNKIEFSATDLDISISTWCGGDVAEDGKLTVNASILSEFVSKLKSSRVELLESGQTLEVKSVDNHAQLYIITAEDFPKLPIEKKKADLIMNSKDLEEAIRKTEFAAAKDESRPILTGILIEATQRNVSLVGVDGFRLSRKKIKVVNSKEEDISVVIPAKALNELAKILMDINASEEESSKKSNAVEVKMYIMKDSNQVIFKVADTTLTSRILEGEFPDYKEIIPIDKSLSFEVEKNDFKNGVKITEIFARKVIGNKTFFKILNEEKKLQLSTNVSDVGNNETLVEIDKIEGDEEELETAYNAAFMSDMISSINGKKIIYETNDSNSPGVFKDPDDKDYVHIIMPMRVE